MILGIIFGVLGGIIAGMGMGGGTLLIPLLVIFLNFTQINAQTINLLAFLPMAIITLIIHCKNHLVDFKNSWLIALIGVGGSILGAYLTTMVQMDFLRICFGAFLIILGTFQLAKCIKNCNKK
ncbi:MAG: TSUP family transporter [Christensenellales bacterium]